MTNRTSRILVVVAVMAIMTPSLWAQSPPHLNPVFSGAVTITGRVGHGVQEVAIYDLSFPVETKLGTSKSIDRYGNFAAMVKPALVKGHQIVAIDENGARSNVVIVGALPAGPAGPAKQ